MHPPSGLPTEANIRIQTPFVGTDQSTFQAECMVGSVKHTPFSTTPAFLANLHRNQMSAQQLAHVPPTNQPFSTLIAAATSQQQVPTSVPAKATTAKGPKTLNVIVPPNIASNIMKMDTNRAKARLSREEEIAENFADDEGPGMEVDDDDDDNDSDADAKPFPRKVDPPVGRKRRAIRSDSKVSSSSSPAAGILSSQDSSQDGDDHSIDEELQKIAEGKKMRGKSHKSDMDIKNDDVSMSGSQSRMGRDLDSKSFKSPAQSPKKRRRGRMRTISQSENRDTSGGTPYSERSKERSLGYKTRGKCHVLHLYVSFS